MANYYFINQWGTQAGPVEKSALIASGVGRDTLVWTEGMASWLKAGQVADLADLFASVPPAPVSPVSPVSNPYSNNGNQKPQNFMWLAILTTILCCLPLGIVSIVYSSKVDSAWARGEYDSARESSEKAKLWGIVSAGVGFFVCIIAFLAGLADL